MVGGQLLRMVRESGETRVRRRDSESQSERESHGGARTCRRSCGDYVVEFPLAVMTHKAGPALHVGCAMGAQPIGRSAVVRVRFGRVGPASRHSARRAEHRVRRCRRDRRRAHGRKSGLLRKLSFTGSTRVGGQAQKLSLELGGNAQFIVFDAAVRSAKALKFRDTAQARVCVNRFYMQDGSTARSPRP